MNLWNRLAYTYYKARLQFRERHPCFPVGLLHGLARQLDRANVWAEMRERHPSLQDALREWGEFTMGRLCWTCPCAYQKIQPGGDHGRTEDP